MLPCLTGTLLKVWYIVGAQYMFTECNYTVNYNREQTGRGRVVLLLHLSIDP